MFNTNDKEENLRAAREKRLNMYKDKDKKHFSLEAKQPGSNTFKILKCYPEFYTQWIYLSKIKGPKKKKKGDIFRYTKAVSCKNSSPSDQEMLKEVL